MSYLADISDTVEFSRDNIQPLLDTALTTLASCPQGWIGTSEGAASCINCAAGRYNSKGGAELESDCTPCVVNTYSAAIGATSASVCVS